MSAGVVLLFFDPAIAAAAELADQPPRPVPMLSRRLIRPAARGQAANRRAFAEGVLVRCPARRRPQRRVGAGRRRRWHRDGGRRRRRPCEPARCATRLPDKGWMDGAAPLS